MRCRFPLYVCLLAGLSACGGRNTSSSVTSPGAPETPKTQALETGAKVLQNKDPMNAVNMYLDGFHFHSGHMQEQMEAHHYCAKLNEDLTQCALYDGNTRQAKLVGIEYVISRKLFQTLPMEEKRLWHSHAYEVQSGQLIAPGIPQAAQHQLMEQLASTYGKTWHTWQTDRHDVLPYGVPELMMGFTADGQLQPALVAARDRRFGVSTEQNRKARADIHAPPPLPGADAWRQGIDVQLEPKVSPGY